jgi:CheY-like chemotaxis protein
MTPILVVDDEPHVLSFMKKLLSRNGFEILQAHDGPTAISVIRQFGGNISALVTDIEMKGMSGIALAKTVTEEFPQIPVLFVTGGAVFREGSAAGCTSVRLAAKAF